jgi:hypothetical protein
MDQYPPNQYPPNQYPPPPPPHRPHDEPNVGMNVLSALQILICCSLPILGVIMYIVWKDTKPRAAKSILTVSLITFAIVFVLGIILFALGFFGAFLESFEDPYYGY